MRWEEQELQQFIDGLKQNWKESTLKIGALTGTRVSVYPDLAQVKTQVDLTTWESLGISPVPRNFPFQVNKLLFREGWGCCFLSSYSYLYQGQGQSSGDCKAKQTQELAIRTCSHPAGQACSICGLQSPPSLANPITSTCSQLVSQCRHPAQDLFPKLIRRMVSQKWS